MTPAPPKPAPPAPAPKAREVAYGEPGAEEVHAGLTEEFKRLALEEAKAGATVLDLGCGEGRAAFLLAPKVKKVVGVDKDAKAIEGAKHRARNLGLSNVEFHVGDAEKEPAATWLAGGPADLVVSHLFLSKTGVERARDALRAGGAFVFTGFGPRQWQEARGSPFAHDEKEVRSWLEGAHLRAEHLATEDVRVTFKQISDVRGYLGEDTVQKWLRDGRWDALVASFPKSKGLTESRLTGRARR